MSRYAAGVRPDIGSMRFRSSWESNFARYLDMLIKLGIVEHWEFEPETFWFKGIKRGTVSYLPDFRIKYRGDPKLEYVEIKGRIEPRDKTKWKRMARYHPHIMLVIVGPKEYRAIARKWASAIPGWETARKVAAARAAA